MSRQKKSGNNDLEYYMSLPYTIRLIPEEAGGYFAEIEELPGCMAQGETQAETLKNLEKSKRMWLESALEIGKEIPLPEEMKEYSGKFLVRIPASLHRRIANLAKKEGVSLNQMVLMLLSERTTLYEIKAEMKNMIWETTQKTEAEYELKYSSMKVAEPDTIYDSLSDKKNIPKVKWKGPSTVES